MKITESQKMKQQSTSTDWSMRTMDSSPMLSEQIGSMSLELDRIEMNTQSDDSDAPFLPKTKDKRDVRAIFDLIMNILESIRGPAKNDIRLKDNN
ncbi:hypothetical protein Bhyg_14642 [Pseudolycoriella hygida]|uniref:Uncharacterized protein n=1 Tax=Pseudolycoriella hygida TaxID=35572 RepID=A0A9Q0RVU0_9DIPT|nr:hypothetical protein Bhyg_14642 [Pseudolycoriella hygida]